MGDVPNHLASGNCTYQEKLRGNLRYSILQLTNLEATIVQKEVRKLSLPGQVTV